MTSKSKLDRQLTLHLEKKYKNVFLTAEEVERETLVTCSQVPSTSDKQGTWLLKDIVEFINRPFYNKEFSKLDKKTKKQYILTYISDSLEKAWTAKSNVHH